jgi:D-alanyl-lipoteichoic acid acyltransferase DltB (MBOAT superfamily)
MSYVEFELLAVVAYILLGRWLVGTRMRWQGAAFGLLNVSAVYVFFFWNRDARFTILFNLLFVAYLALVSLQYVAMRRWSQRPGSLPWLAFLAPIGILAVIRYTPIGPLSALFSPAIYGVLQRHPEFTLSWIFTGISYLAFRTSYLVLEVRNGVVPRPGFWEYLGFAFFAPTLSVGPISPYSQHHRAFAETGRPHPGEVGLPIGRPEISVGTALLRVLTGAVKFRFFGPLLNQLTYSGLLLDGHPHRWVDLPIAAVAYYLYLYCNFSGFCDIAIGCAGLMGVPVAENFANPFAARNLRDFWNRWHITLSQYMRDVVFSPLSKILVRLIGAHRANHAIALAIFVVFLLVGVWHGVGWNYAAYGGAHALGVATDFYYTLALKRRLGRDRFVAYERNPVIRAAAVSLTFLYVTATLFLFANDFRSMKTIFAMLRWH